MTFLVYPYKASHDDWLFDFKNGTIQVIMINKIPENELKEILESYDVHGVVFEASKWVTPDSMVYIFSDKNGAKYVLYSADYLGGYDEIDLPFDFEFDDEYPYSKVSFRAVKIFSYKKDSKKKAEGYIDDNHYWTKASTGDVCMLFGVSDLKF